ncbi:Chitin binding Peritrophin-A domain [Popillia japonica]|uniref:Chitin binding Peritrophin-A domain n=1 Tax=Popillia japonica TaxID=7064 RepID=A0AAW1KJ44_POPJA
MKAIFYVCCAILLALPLVKSDPVGECPAENGEYDVLLPDSSDCAIFYKCNEGEAVVQDCPDGLAFNPELTVCDYPANVDCP